MLRVSDIVPFICRILHTLVPVNDIMSFICRILDTLVLVNDIISFICRIVDTLVLVNDKMSFICRILDTLVLVAQIFEGTQEWNMTMTGTMLNSLSIQLKLINSQLQVFNGKYDYIYLLKYV